MPVRTSASGINLIFGSLHFWNPEMSYSPLLVGMDYVLAGIIWCYISAKTNSAELTIGAHTANNMLHGWFLTMDNSAFGEIPSLFVVTSINPGNSLLWSVITLGIFLYLAQRKYGFKKEKAID
ncbi:type II CAAX prenyl endopeptidase Rce1 family protein [Bacillus salitolerans]|uniref:Type II CAAX prenyl endopeptidase Rce1 family protein n=1 Tax=Bacillus salitolerans TaxID=1437434 RepID=A0ABW4LS52_9BACI